MTIDTGKKGDQIKIKMESVLEKRTRRIEAAPERAT